ncbi:translation initiation factor IF-2 subunit gamma [Candidatus Pacearchaeota archaeon]|nr:translation initiation factor IF-2 subunit gamma [Candidatus Pacearchaeota archaeon]|tara:strand:+ start:5950 stop:7146 length:1197 start_codon:yes stop_codon:yes gene_type:complete
MSKSNIEILPVLNVGMVGHIDHGKTTLLSALSGKFADTHSEELKRGITIKLGYADVVLKKQGGKFGIKDGDDFRYLTFVDVPGHEMLMATMLSGAAVIDVAILVVAANEGIKPQTREHLIALQTKHIDKVVVVQNKIDLVSKEEAVRNYEEIKKFVKGTIAENSEVIPVSALQGVNIDKIYEVLGRVEIPERDLKSDPVFVIARSFDINKPGTSVDKLHGGVLGGALKRGVLKVGDEIEIRPGILIKEKNQEFYEPVKTRITSIYRGSYDINEAVPGGSLAIETELDMALTKTDLLSGEVAGKVGGLPDVTDNLKIRAEHFKVVFGVEESAKVEDYKVGEMLMLSVNTSTTVGKIVKISGDELELKLSIPVVGFKGNYIGIARNLKGHWRLIGFGEVL